MGLAKSSNNLSISSYLQVINTSTDLNSEFSAPFKAGTSRQVQTCLQSTENTDKEIQHFNWFILDRRNGNSDDLETQSVNVKRLPLKRAVVFSFNTNAKLRRSLELVIKYHYHTFLLSKYFSCRLYPQSFAICLGYYWQ